MVSALIPSKRVMEGIEVASRIDGAWLVLAGDGPMRDAVDQAGRERLGKRFRRVILSPIRMPELYQAANAVLHMSLDEPSGHVFTEALATDLPIVAHDRLVSRWTLGDSSYLVDTTDFNATADALRRALAEPSGIHCEERLNLVHSRYTWASIAAQYTKSIADVLPRSTVTFATANATA